MRKLPCRNSCKTQKNIKEKGDNSNEKDKTKTEGEMPKTEY